MAITTYAELKTAVANWLHRDDLTAIIPDFITIGESRINRKLRVRPMETSATLTPTAGVRTVALPSGFLQAKRLYVDGSVPTALEYISPPDYWKRYLSIESNTPRVYTVEAENFLFGPVPNGTDIICLYYQRPSALSSAVNAIFTANPELYLYAALVAAEPYLKNDKRIPLWKLQFEEILSEVQAADDRDRAAGAPMMMRTDYAIV